MQTARKVEAAKRQPNLKEGPMRRMITVCRYMTLMETNTIIINVSIINITCINIIPITLIILHITIVVSISGKAS